MKKERTEQHCIYSDELYNILFEYCDRPDTAHIPIMFGKDCKEGKDISKVVYSKKDGALIIE